MAAVDAVMRFLNPGDHVIAGDDMYGGSFRLFDRVVSRHGVEFTYVDLSRPEAVRQAVRDQTRIIYAETPTNPTMKVCDLNVIAEIASEAGAKLVVDNTFMTPYLQRPLDHGASVVLHSSTKYIGGHSDVIGGLVVTNDESMADEIGFHQNSCGGVPAPIDCYLTLRSLKTLSVRMDRHCSNALVVADFLEKSGEFSRVIYPELPSYSQREIADRQMHGFGGMLSADIGSYERAARFAESVNLFFFAESLGGVESLICHPATMTHAAVPPETRRELGITDGLLRFSVGIEDAEDLLDDIRTGLNAVQQLDTSRTTSDA
jgi:cystathionine gamma-lyase